MLPRCRAIYNISAVLSRQEEISFSDLANVLGVSAAQSNRNISVNIVIIRSRRGRSCEWRVGWPSFSDASLVHNANGALMSWNSRTHIPGAKASCWFGPHGLAAPNSWNMTIFLTTFHILWFCPKHHDPVPFPPYELWECAVTSFNPVDNRSLIYQSTAAAKAGDFQKRIDDFRSLLNKTLISSFCSDW